MADEIDRIVAGLTKAQRDALLSATDAMSSHGGYPFFIVRHTGEPWPQGVAQFLTYSNDRLTPLGLAVRAALQEAAKIAEGWFDNSGLVTGHFVCPQTSIAAAIKKRIDG